MELDKITALSDGKVGNTLDTTQISVLYVDDEKINLRIFKLLMKKQFDIIVSNSAKDALEKLDEKEIHVIISDQKMDGMNGTELLKKVNENHPKVVKMLLTGDNNQVDVRNAMKNQNIFACINKPFDQEQLSELFVKAYLQYNKN